MNLGSILSSVINNPVLKTIASAAAGGALTAVSAALSNPTGGMLTALQSDPVYGAVFTIGALLVHNLASSATFAQKS